MGIVKRMPRSVQEAWTMLSEDTALVSELGEEFVRKYIAVRKVKDPFFPTVLRVQFEAEFIVDWDGMERKKWMIERM